MLRLSLQARVAAIAVAAVFVLLLAYTLTIVASALGGHAAGQRMLAAIVPLPFYLFALWSARVAIARIGRGEALRVLISPMLRRIGWSLFAGGLAQVFVVPWLWMLQGRGRLGYFDVNAITLGAIGVMLIFMAHLVSEAERDRAELDEIL